MFGARPFQACLLVVAFQFANVSIARTFDLQKTRLEFRFEVFNMFNRTIWGNPDSTITSANFGRVTTLNTSPRQMQLGLRFEF
jgi:hypothetical protein